jgi:hypothetical protein
MDNQRLKELLTYDPETGVFTWIKRSNNIAGAVDAYGYIVIRLDKILYKAHRLAWLYMYGNFPSCNLDHINQIKNDNRICNLRMVTQSQNMQNLSGIKGISWDKSRAKWCARIKVMYKTIYLGRFTNKDDAVAARKAAEVIYFTHGVIA